MSTPTPSPTSPTSAPVFDKSSLWNVATVPALQTGAGYLSQAVSALSPYIANLGVVGNVVTGLVNGSLVIGADYLVNLISQKMVPDFIKNHDVVFKMIKIAVITAVIAALNFAIPFAFALPGLKTLAIAGTITKLSGLSCAIAAAVSVAVGQLAAFGLQKGWEMIPSGSGSTGSNPPPPPPGGGNPSAPTPPSGGGSQPPAPTPPTTS